MANPDDFEQVRRDLAAFKRVGRAERRVTGRVRRTLSLLFACALLIAGLALAAFEIANAEGLRPFVLVGAGLMIGAAGVRLVDEFLRPLGRRNGR